MIETNASIDAIKEYYGKTLKDISSLKTNACCCTESLPAAHLAILAQIDEEILSKFYGCGSRSPRRWRVHGSGSGLRCRA